MTGSARNRLRHPLTAALDMATRLLPAFGSCLNTHVHVGDAAFYSTHLDFRGGTSFPYDTIRDTILTCARKPT